MILTDREIQAAIHARQIIIDPLPLQEAFSSTSIDLTLSKFFQIWKPPPIGVDQVISPGSAGYNYHEINEAYAERIEGTLTTGVILEPGQFLLAWTEETVSLPTHGRLAARVEGKSSLARLGVSVHITAPTIHSGFTGQIQLEMYNHNTLRVRLLPGMRICTLIIEMCLGTPDKGYQGIFSGQKSH